MTHPDLSRSPHAAALLLSACVLLSLSGCSPLPLECTQDSSCRQTRGAASFCAEDGICDTYTPSQYLAAPCNVETVGPVFEPGTFNVGVVLALNRQAEYYGLIEPMAKAIKLAVGDVNTGPGIAGRKMGLIFCNTDGKNELAQAAAEHLVDVGVQAIIGPDFSGYTLEVVPRTLVPGGVLAISPSATAPAISGLDDQDLMWRTVASDTVQATVLPELVKSIRDDVIGANAQTPGAPRIAMLVRENDAYADGLSQGIIAALPSEVVNNMEVFKSFNYPNSGRDEGDDYSQVAIAVANYKPDLVLVWGLTEVWEIIDSLDRLLEQDHGLTQTIFVTADGGKDPVRAAEVGGRRASLSGRVWGTAPGSLDPDEYPPYKSFEVRWNSTYGTDACSHPFITNAYDAVYLLAFAAAASGKEYPTGAELAAGMKRLTIPTGTPIAANQQDFPAGISALSNGGTIDFRGASGPLEFDARGDVKSTTITLWCLDKTSIKENGDLLTAGSTTVVPQSCAEFGMGGN